MSTCGRVKWLLIVANEHPFLVNFFPLSFIVVWVARAFDIYISVGAINTVNYLRGFIQVFFSFD